MTSQNLSKKKNLFWVIIGQNKPFMLLHALVLLLTCTIPAVIAYTGRQTMDDGYSYMSETVRALLNFSAIGGYAFVPAVISFFAALFMFNYLFRRDSTIMMHALPITRVHMYLTRAAAGIVTLMVPFAAVTALNWMIAVSWHMVEGIWENAGLLALLYLAFFFVYAFSMTLSCNFIAYVAVACCTMFYFPLAELTVIGILSERSFRWSYSPSDLIYYTCPIAPYLLTFDERESLYRFLPGMLIVSAALFLLGLWIMTRRKSENSDLFVCFPWLQATLKYMLTLLAAFGIGIVFQDSILTLVWYFIFAFITFIILQGIFDRTLKGMFANMKHFAVLAACMAAAMALMYFDVLGIDRYTPPRSSVTAVEMKVPATWSKSSYLEMTVATGEPEVIDAWYALMDKGQKYGDQSLSCRFNHNKQATLEFYVGEKDLEAFYDTVYDHTNFKKDWMNALKKAKFRWFRLEKNTWYDLDSDDQKTHAKMEDFLACYERDLLRCSLAEREESGLYGQVNGYGDEYYSLEVPMCFTETIEYLEKTATVADFDAVVLSGRDERIVVSDRKLCREILKYTYEDYMRYASSEEDVPEEIKAGGAYAVYVRREDGDELIGSIETRYVPEAVWTISQESTQETE